MMVRPGKKYTEQEPRGAQAELAHISLPSPTNGLVLGANRAEMPPLSAIDVENGVPTTRGMRVRGGSAKFAYVGAAVESLFTFRTGSINNLYAAANGKIYNVTSVADVDVAPTPVITGQTSNYYSTTTFSAGGGDYLVMCNGTDNVKTYDGTTYADAGITPSAPATLANLSQVFQYRKRLFFIVKDTLTFAYLGVNNIGGAATNFELQGVFRRGGSLLFGATWSQDAGDGLDDKAVFVTDLGEVAIYQGSDPSSATDWTLVGRYDITPPLGKNAFTYAGGDLVVMTQDGMVPISLAVNKEPSVLALSAITRPIEPLWKEEVAQRSLPWEFVEIPKLNMGIATLPSTGNLPSKCLPVSLQTSKWGCYTGWDARCVAELGGNGYFGANDGYIYLMESGGTDNGEPYLFKCALAPNDLGSPGIYKTAKMARATFIAHANFTPQVSASTNYSVSYPPAPNAGANISGGSLWDTAVWDTAVWGGGLDKTILTRWQTVVGGGFSISPQVQALIANDVNPEAELITLDMSYVGGGLHVA